MPASRIRELALMALEPESEVCRPVQARVVAVQEMHRVRELESVWSRAREAEQYLAGVAVR